MAPTSPTHLERDGAPSILREDGAWPGSNSVWCGAEICYAAPVNGWALRLTNTTTDPARADCPACWMAVRAAWAAWAAKGA